MPRYAPRDEISEKVLKRLVSLSSQKLIAQARARGLDDVVPADFDPSKRAYADPRTGKLFSRRSVQEAKSFYEGPYAGRFRSLKEVTNESVRRERVLDDAGLTFQAGDWAARHERDLKAAAIERAYVRRLRRRGDDVPTKAERWAQGSDFLDALSRLTEPMPKGTKEWKSDRARELKTRALEVLGLRPEGFDPPTGAYTPAELAAAWRDAGVKKPPQLVFQYKKTR